jgi:hypothetical protein
MDETFQQIEQPAISENLMDVLEPPAISENLVDELGFYLDPSHPALSNLYP